MYHLFRGIQLPKYSLKSFMSSREVSVSGVLTHLFPTSTIESLTLQAFRSGLLSSSSWHRSSDYDNSASTNGTQPPQSKKHNKEDKQLHTSAWCWCWVSAVKICSHFCILVPVFKEEIWGPGVLRTGKRSEDVCMPVWPKLWEFLPLSGYLVFDLGLSIRQTEVGWDCSGGVAYQLALRVSSQTTMWTLFHG